MKRFVPRYLDPASRLGEILFGLIMVLTITLTAGFVVDEGRKGVRELLLAAIGCNLAWGFIDAVMYLMSCVTVRSEKAKLITAVQSAPDTGTALALIQEGVEPELQSMLHPNDNENFNRTILQHLSRAHPIGPTLSRDDFYGALACFILVFFSCLPAAIPFFILSHPGVALRISNCLLIALLFVVGRKWARYVGVSPLWCGSIMVLVGLALVGVAILLGG
jgi:hypothetical protein